MTRQGRVWIRIFLGYAREPPRPVEVRMGKQGLGRTTGLQGFKPGRINVRDPAARVTEATARRGPAGLACDESCRSRPADPVVREDW